MASGQSNEDLEKLVHREIEHFQLPLDLQEKFEVTKRRKNTPSIIFDWGIKVEGKGGEDEEENTDAESDTQVGSGRKRKKSASRIYWICFHPDCRNPAASDEYIYDDRNWIKLSATSTFQATRHLLTRHGITTSKTKQIYDELPTSKTLDKRKSQLAKQMRVDSKRASSLQITRFLIKKCLPPSAVEDEEFKLCFPDEGSGIAELDAVTIERHVAEIYYAMRQRTSIQLSEVKRYFGSQPWLHLYIETYAPHGELRKYLAIRVSYTYKGTFRSNILAVRPWNSAFEGAEADRYGKLLKGWVEEVFDDFGISERDVFSAASDCDLVQRQTCKALEYRAGKPCLWECSIPQLANRVLIDAFGASLSAKSSRNIEARKIFDSIFEVIETCYRHDFLENLIRDKNSWVFGAPKKMLINRPHQWAGVCRILAQVIESWPQLLQEFSNFDLEWPLRRTENTVEEFLALLTAVQKVIVHSQGHDIVGAYISLLLFHREVLREGKSLLIDRSKQMKRDYQIERSPDELNPATISVKSKLREGFEKRFFERYHPIKALTEKGIELIYGEDDRVAAFREPGVFRFSYRLDATSLLHPGLKAGSHIKEMIRTTKLSSLELERLPRQLDEETVKELFYETVYEYCQHILREHALLAVAPSKDVQAKKGSPAKKKRRKKSDPLAAAFINSFINPSEPSDRHVEEEIEESRGDASAKLASVTAEIESYFSDVGPSLEELKTSDVLKYWTHGESQEKWPMLSKSAEVLLSEENDVCFSDTSFSGKGEVLTEKKSRMDVWLYEAFLYAHVNFEDMPTSFSAIPELPSEAYKNSLPDRLTNTQKTKRLKVIETSIGNLELVFKDITDESNNQDCFDKSF